MKFKRKMKYKFDRKRAIECKINKRIDDDTWSYDILIGDKDGSTKWETSQGKDMADALEKLLWIERHQLIEKMVNKTSLNVMMLAWFISLVVPGIISHALDSHIPILVTLIFNFTLFISWWAFHRWVKSQRK